MSLFCRWTLRWPGCSTWRLAGGGLLCPGLREPAGAGAGFEDVAAEGEPVDDRGAEPGVGEDTRAQILAGVARNAAGSSLARMRS
jgi:hypothetical protein